jgi:hypothetical protein
MILSRGIAERFPQWTPEFAGRLSRRKKRIQTQSIHCRCRASSAPRPKRAVRHVFDPTLRGIVLNDEVFCSIQHFAMGKPPNTPHQGCLAAWQRGELLERSRHRHHKQLFRPDIGVAAGAAGRRDHGRLADLGRWSPHLGVDVGRWT